MSVIYNEKNKARYNGNAVCACCDGSYYNGKLRKYIKNSMKASMKAEVRRAVRTGNYDNL